MEKVRDIVFARTGKDLVLPRKPGKAQPEMVSFDAAGEQRALKPTTGLGPSVIVDDTRGMKGRVLPVSLEPIGREFECLCAGADPWEH